MVINNNMKLLWRKRFIIKICYNTQLLLFKCTFCIEPKWCLLQTSDLLHLVPMSHAVLLNDACNSFSDFLNLIIALCITSGLKQWKGCQSRECHTYLPPCARTKASSSTALRLAKSPNSLWLEKRGAMLTQFCRLRCGKEPGDGNGSLSSRIKVNRNCAHYLCFQITSAKCI